MTALPTTVNLALEPGFGSMIGRGVGAIVLYAVVGLVLLMIGFYVIDITTPGPLAKLLRTGHPNAVTIVSAGLLSMALVVVVAIFESGGQLADGLLSALIFGLLGIVVQALAVRALEFVARIDMGALLEAERFTPLSIAVAAAQVALGLVVAVAIS